MADFWEYVFQDWDVNHDASIKSRFILVMFRSTQLISKFPPPFSIIYRNFYRLIVEWIFGVDLIWDTQVGENLKLFHSVGLVVSPECIIGVNCTLNHCTTIGKNDSNSGSPKIGNYVNIGSNCVILGPITIGDRAVISSGSVVVDNVPEGSVVLGNPARIIRILNLDIDTDDVGSVYDIFQT